MNSKDAAQLTQNKHFFRFFMPYVFQRLEGFGNYVFLPLNRNYKPLGQISQQHVEYVDYIHQAARFDRDPMKLLNIWKRIDSDQGLMWLYDDNPSSRFDYFERFGNLMTKSIKPASIKD